MSVNLVGRSILKIEMRKLADDWVEEEEKETGC